MTLITPVDFSTCVNLTRIEDHAFYFYGGNNSAVTDAYINLINTKVDYIGPHAFRAYLKDSVNLISLPNTLISETAIGE